MKELNSMLIALLRSVLCGEELKSEVLKDLDEQTLDELYKLSKKHDMSHLLGAALEKAGLLPEGKIGEKLLKQQMMAIYRYENMQYEIDRVKAALDKASIPYIPLKGSVIRALYPEPWMRMSCDVDILVHEKDLEKARDQLVRELSYKCSETHTDHDISLYSEGGVHVELHYNLQGKDERANKTLDKSWESARRVNEYSFEYAFSNEFAVFYCIAHALNHFLNGGCGIRTLSDLYFMMGKLDIDEGRLNPMLAQSGLERFGGALISLSKYWFDDGEGSELLYILENFILAGGSYGNTDGYVAVRQKREGGKIGYIRSRLFVPYRALKVRYPQLKSRALIPIYQVRRWIDVARGGRTEAAIRELEIGSSIDESSSSDMGKLLDGLGLDKK